MTETARWTFLPDILEEHIENGAFLWGQRQAGLRAGEWTFPKFRELESRITAHLDGIRVVGADAVPPLEMALGSDDANDVFIGATGLLQPDAGDRADTLVEALQASEGARRTGLVQALAQAPATPVSRIAELSKSADPALAAACAEVLVFHHAFDREPARIEPFLLAADPALQKAGWRIAALGIVPVPAKRYAAGVREEDAALRAMAIEAGAWCGAQGVLDILRHLADAAPADNVDALLLLGVLGDASDAARIRDLGSNPALGPRRFELLAAGGRSAFIPLLIAGMEDPDPVTAVAAGAAFARLTGLNIDSTDVVTAPPATDAEGEDAAFEAEFADPLTLPDANAARREWALLSKTLGGADRIAAGRSIDTLDAATFAAIDMRSRYEASLASRFRGGWNGSLVDLERFERS